jgi:hypothetical protein
MGARHRQTGRLAVGRNIYWSWPLPVNGDLVWTLNYKNQWGETRAIYFSHRTKPPDFLLTLNGWDIPFVNSVKYLGIIFDKKMAWRLHIKTIEAKAIRTFIRIYPLLKSEQLSTNFKLALHKALIRYEMTYACPTWEFASETHLLKLQRVQNRVLRTIANFPSHTSIWDMHVASQVPYIYDYVTELCRRQA